MNFLYDNINETLDEIFGDTKREGFEDKKEENTGTWGAGLFNRGSSEEEKEEEKEEKEEKEEEKGNDWKGFLSSMINNFVLIIIFVLISGNILFITKNMINISDIISSRSIESAFSKRMFPTNKNEPPYNTSSISNIALKFPYFKMRDNSTYLNQFLNWFSSTLQYAWIYYRSINKFIFTGFSGVFKELDSTTKDIGILKSMIMYLYFLISPLLYLFFVIFNPIVSFWGAIVAGFTSVNENNVGSDSLIFKIISLYPSFLLGCTMFILTLFHTPYLLLIKPLIINPRHIFNHMKTFSHVIETFFYVLLLVSISRYLSIEFLIPALIIIGGIIFYERILPLLF